MTKVAFISHSDCGRHDTGWKHPEHVGRLRAITRALRNDPDLFHLLDHVEGRHATDAELALAHDAAYIERVRAMAEQGGGQMDTDTVLSAGTWDAASAATGCVLDAIDRAMSGTNLRSFCAVRPPGHHALRANAMGFCFFGNVAVGARYAMQRYGLERVLVIDWDVHHGNGTQALVEDTPGIHFVSMHQWPWYPGTGAKEDRGPHSTVWNVPMPALLPREEYTSSLRAAIAAATQDWEPQLVMISAGFDSLRGDPLGGFTLEMEDVYHLTRELSAQANVWCGGKIVSALEGGYDPARVAEACVVHMRALAEE
jgi:acetoin utilization deacetylase AcuC-like enzyme